MQKIFEMILFAVEKGVIGGNPVDQLLELSVIIVFDEVIIIILKGSEAGLADYFLQSAHQQGLFFIGLAKVLNKEQFLYHYRQEKLC